MCCGCHGNKTVPVCKVQAEGTDTWSNVLRYKVHLGTSVCVCVCGGGYIYYVRSVHCVCR